MNKPIETIHESQAVALDSPTSISQSVLPYYVDDTKKTKYLSFRATGFTASEAMELTDVHKRTVATWRADDSEFKRLEGPDIAELRQTHGAAYHSAEFQRNLRAFMELDRKMIARAHAVINSGGELSDLDIAEQGYLKTIRPLYSAQNLAAMMKAVSGGKDADTDEMDFSKLVNSMSNIRIEVEQSRAVINGSLVSQDS